MTTKYNNGTIKPIFMYNNIWKDISSPNFNKVDLYIQNVVVAKGSILKFKYHNNKKEISLKDTTVRLCGPRSMFIWKQ